jgi:hypothetical protein
MTTQGVVAVSSRSNRQKRKGNYKLGKNIKKNKFD